MTLTDFVVKCKKCGQDAVIEQRDNGACGNPSCCGDYREYIVFKCVLCETEERPDARLAGQPATAIRLAQRERPKRFATLGPLCDATCGNTGGHRAFCPGYWP